MSTRRVKNVAYDDDDLDWGDGDWGDSSWGGTWDAGWNESSWNASSWSAPASKPAAAKAKTGAAAKPAAKAAAGKAAAAKPKAAATTAAAAGKAPPAAGAAKAPASASAADVASRKAPAPAVKAEAESKFEPPPRGATAKEPAAAKKGATAPAKAAQAKKEEPQECEEAVANEEEETAAPPPAPDPAAEAKPSISLVVVGHVDAGKSTLMGHLLCLVGTVTAKTLHKFEKESKQIGKASFAYAWVLDEGQDERERGVTIDVCVKHFATENRRFTILDAPGHRDFVPNMLQGAVQADAALLVADVSHFESGFDRGGQTKEHLQLIRSLGINNLVVAVNKLDTCNWSQEVYEDIKGRLHTYITGSECGYKSSAVRYVPLSGFTGENMLERKESALSWWTGPTLLQALDQLPPPARPPSNGPLRVVISDLYRTGSNSVASGKVEAGAIQHGQKVILLPSGEQTTVKNLQARGEPTQVGRAGDYLDAVTLPIEPQFASIGGVISDVKNPVPVVDCLQVQILVFEVDVPIMRGQQVMCYLHTETLTATIMKLEALIVKGKKQDKRPKCLQKGNSAVVQLRVSRKVCVEPKPANGAPATSLSRLVLRDRGRTVAAGVVLSVSQADVMS